KEHVGYLLLHVGVHMALLAGVFYQHISSSWPYIVFIGLAHLAIDSLKIVCEKKWPSNSVLFFLTDQLLHILVILSVVFYSYGLPLHYFAFFTTDKFLAYTVALLLTVVVSPIFLRVFFTKWSKEHVFHVKKEETLLDAGL